MATDHSPPTADATLDAIGDAVISVNDLAVVTYLNAVAEALTGWTRAAAVGRPIDEVFQIVDGTTHTRLPDPLTMAMARNAVVGVPAGCVLVGRDRAETPIEDSTAPIHDAEGAVIGAVVVFRHVGAALATARDMAHAAMHDPLTGLPNRQLLLDRLTTALALNLRRNRPLAVCFIDVDGFKAINDSLGHPAGDQVLQMIGTRLLAAVRQSDTVCRYGGDEFVVLLSEIAGAANIPGIASTLLTACRGPHRIGRQDVSISASLGVALCPRDGMDAPTLIANADRAMYGAKNMGAGRYLTFDAAMGRASAFR